MRYWIGITDPAWFAFHAVRAPLDEVSFWHPGGRKPITLEPGAPWIFRRPLRAGGEIVGGAFFAHFSKPITPQLLWDAFGERNGAASLAELVRMLQGFRSDPIDPLVTELSTSILVEPFFLPPERWIRPPADWAPNITQGKAYDTTDGEGGRIWTEVRAAAAAIGIGDTAGSERRVTDAIAGGYGVGAPARHRLGQGAFRMIVTDAYERRCAITGEKTLPVLEAAHIKPFAQVGTHQVENGLLLRSDLHRLFDLGYLSVTPTDRTVRVSPKIREQFSNGRDYYALDRRPLRAPQSPFPEPARELLEWHMDEVFRR